MAVTDRDFSLLQEEIKCLRKKFASTLGTSGGYVNGPVTAPGSSIFPNSNYDDCSCVSIDTQKPNPLTACAPNTTEDIPIGDFANDIPYEQIEGLFVFDAVSGVFYKGPVEESYENRNTGLSDTTLEHGCLDAWWYRKQTPDEDSVILWRVGDSKVLFSSSSGRKGWTSRTPSNVPTGYEISDIRFIQIVSDPYTQNNFYMVATTINAPYRLWILKSTDNGQEWTWTDLTTYNSKTQRKPGWMTLAGPGASLIWLTCWNNSNELEVLKLNNDPTITVSAAYALGSSTEYEFENRYAWAGASCALDSNIVWIYGLMNNPQSLGNAHVIRAENDGLNWYVVENTWGSDWCGSFKASMALNGARNFYAVRNVR